MDQKIKTLKNGNMRNKIKNGVEKVIKENTFLLTKPNYQERIMYIYLTTQEGIDHRAARLMVQNFTLLDSVKRRIRLTQEMQPNYRDKEWVKRQGKSKEVSKEIIDEKNDKL